MGEFPFGCIQEGNVRAAIYELGTVVVGATHGDHEAFVRGDGEFGVAQINVFKGQEPAGFPVLAVFGAENTDGAIAYPFGGRGDVSGAFAEGAVEITFPA